MNQTGIKVDLELVEQARQGNKDSINQLLETIYPQLASYVYRTTLDHDLKDEVVQETILEAYKDINKLRQQDRFWPWIRGIAYHKLCQFYKMEKRQRDILEPTLAHTYMKKRNNNIHQPDHLGKLISEEQKAFIMNSMKKLKPKHRQIINLRCFEGMDYSEIAEMTDSSAFSARVAFFRAKKELQKIFTSNGMANVSLLSALIAFAKMTSESSAATLSQHAITNQTLHVGLPATIAGYMGTKTTMTAATIALVGGISGSVAVKSIANTPEVNPSAQVAQMMTKQTVINSGNKERWFYYPEGPDKPVMIRTMKVIENSKNTTPYSLQNEQGNFLFTNGAIQINNFRLWNSDFSVQRLPTDSPELTYFLNKVEGRSVHMEPMTDSFDDLLVINQYNQQNEVVSSEVNYLPDATKELYYLYDKPSGNTFIDNRDAMHQRGWTGFRINGQLNGIDIQGKGQIPFTFSHMKNHTPWMQIDSRNDTLAIDHVSGSAFLDSQENVVASLPNLSLFKGMSRPWTGIHTLDVIRRDAAMQQLWFNTEIDTTTLKSIISVDFSHQGIRGNIEYHVDLEKDLLDKIVIISDSLSGEIMFEYLQDMPGNDFNSPQLVVDSQGFNDESHYGVLWPIELANLVK